MNVLLGATGGIAAYKAAELVRRLRERGHEVRCAMTRGAEAFLSPLTLEVLSGHAVYDERYLAANGSGKELHLEAAGWADVLCIAPATAHTVSRLALGLADDFLTTAALAFEGPLVVAPAMHPAMWGKEAVRGHVASLERRGAWFVGPVEGPLASGAKGLGRMAEPIEIAEAVEAAAGGGTLAGKTVLVSAGPTREALDPVRFISNRSSGKMGFALAAAARRRGARTILVTGPVALATPPGVERVDVTTAREMEEAMVERADAADLVLMAAAVADYRPRDVATRKLRRREGPPAVELEENPDVLAAVIRAAGDGALVVGFAAETEDLEVNARVKLEEKGVDFLVANDVSRRDVGFDSDDNEVTVFRRDGDPVVFARQDKQQLASRLLDLFAEAHP